MVGGLKIVVVREGQERQFEALFDEFRKVMRDQEPHCLVYSLLRSRASARSYIVHEQYRDQAALDAHQSSPHGKVYFPKMRDVLESIAMEYFDGVVD